MAARTVAYLALQEQAVERGLVAGLLWPHVTDNRAAANLRTTLWRIPHAGEHGLIVVDGPMLSISPAVSVDHRRAVALAREILGRGCDAAETLDEDSIRMMLRLLTSELLTNWYDEWLHVYQERWRQLRLHALDSMALALVDCGRYALAIDAATASVDAEPLRESGYRCLMHAHLAQGNISEVIRTHRTYRELLHRELGVRPSPKMVQLLDSAIGA